MTDILYKKIKGKFIVANSLDDPDRTIVGNRWCVTHNEIFVYRPSVNPKAEVEGVIEMKLCKDGCWKE